MTPEPVSLRPAEPTLDDGLSFARYLDYAADGFFRVLLGRNSDQIVATAFTKPGHDLSYERVTFAELDASIVGMASGYTAEQHHHSSDEPLTSAAGRLRVLRITAVSAIGRPILRFIESVPDGDFYLQALGVDDDRRGLGIGSTLIDHVEERARSQNCDRLALDVAANNEAAQRLYERRGMTVEARSPRLITRGSQALRMVKPL